MSCYIRKLLPRGSSILSRAPFTTSSSGLVLKGPSSQLVSRKIDLRPVHGQRCTRCTREPDNDDDGGKDWRRYERQFVKERLGRKAAEGFSKAIKDFLPFAMFSLSLSLFSYVVWNAQPSRADERRNKQIDDMFARDVPMRIKPHENSEVNRDETVALIKNRFMKDNEHQFGIIIGPEGTGKSFVTQRACHENPFGIIYTKLDPDNLVETFAKETGILLERRRGLSGFVPKEYRLNGVDEYDEFGAITAMISMLSKRAKDFRNKHNQMPCLFIDGVDILAKKYPREFSRLVGLAKVYANDGIFRVIFVSSQHVMPLYQSTSAFSRSKEVLEILDLDDEKGKEYLVKNGLPPRLAEKVVEFAGGRMIFLLDAVDMYNAYKYKKNEDNNDITIEDPEKVLEKIKRDLRYDYTKSAYRKLLLSADRSSVKLLLKEMSSGSHERIELVKCFDKIKGDNSDEGVRCICMTAKSLVEANVFRYDGRGYLRYHNRIIANDIKNGPPL